MRIVLAIEHEALLDAYNWKLFEAQKIAMLLSEFEVRILQTDSLRQKPSDGFLKRIHFSIEGRLSRLNHYDSRPSSNSVIGKINILADDLIINLSDTSVAQLHEEFKYNTIWQAIYHDRPLQSMSHIGESEVVNHHETIDITLIEYVPGKEASVLDTVRHNPHSSAIRNFQNAAYSLHFLIAKNLRKRNSDQGLNMAAKRIDYSFLLYVLLFYKYCLQKVYGTIIARIAPNLYSEHWTVGISRGNYLDDGLQNLTVCPLPKGEFWADPFLYMNPDDQKLYLLIERFPFKQRKGVLACGEVDSQLNVCNMHDILVKPYHVSYPHLITEDNELYMMPESSANSQLEVYHCEKFPDEWSLYSTGFEGQSVVDTVYYQDKNGDRWLFTTITDSDVVMHCTVMNIYKIDSLKLKSITPHRQNPIIIDSSIARNGGRIFEQSGHVYRVAQNNVYGEYGHGTSVREIMKLTLEEYEEVEVSFLEGTQVPGFKFNHHLCQIEGAFVVDLRK